ncbi:GNAT family N-acetyltransferase [Cellulomonas sp. NS3]|uniref:GNAT family N-acetyltransferase n=1 Tax=Cellulomonas sp. NS3 TaxID=2973977 RepID=UPI0021636921|nr:GNAT family N-acetyltransferase [Cellulomonas sp. NS3]
MSTWTVRRVTPADEQAWRALYRAYREFYAAPDDESALDTVWAWALDPAHEVEAWVAADADGRLGGLAHVRRFARPLAASTGLYLDDLVTHPDRRREGVGTAVLEHLQRYAAAEGLTVVRWITAADNARARALYDQHADATPWVTYDLAPGSAPAPGV